MRIMLTILSGFTGLILVQHADLLVRLDDLLRGGVRPDPASAWVGLIGAWALATALVYPAPRAAGWLFGGAGVFGLVVGVSNDVRVIVTWAALATGLALLTLPACWEQRAADRAERHREQREVAVHLALRSLQETVPDLLARVPKADHSAAHQQASSAGHADESGTTSECSGPEVVAATEEAAPAAATQHSAAFRSQAPGPGNPVFASLPASAGSHNSPAC
jgi:hypothetical protein